MEFLIAFTVVAFFGNMTSLCLRWGLTDANCCNAAQLANYNASVNMRVTSMHGNGTIIHKITNQ